MITAMFVHRRMLIVDKFILIILYQLISGKKFGIDGSGYIPRGKRVSAGKLGALDEDEEVREIIIILHIVCAYVHTYAYIG
jgi:hypothetical protein